MINGGAYTLVQYKPIIFTTPFTPPETKISRRYRYKYFGYSPFRGNAS